MEVVSCEPPPIQMVLTPLSFLTPLQYESSVAVRDRVAFACMFLNDTQLPRYIEKLTNEMKEAGNLEGILLTGLTKDGVDLMESYVDRTGDVQTASFCMLKNVLHLVSRMAADQGSPGEVVKDQRVQRWIENYRNLLDAWRFWHKRAEFDIHRSKLDPSSKPLAQAWRPQYRIHSCNFCGKSISYSCSAMPHQGRGFSQYGVSGSPTKSKVTSCPGCRKPLPRCALCLMNMGTPVSSCPGKSDEKVDLSKDKKLAQFNNWFTWCHNCRHGGHAGHMLSWFRDHTECPVSACTWVHQPPKSPRHQGTKAPHETPNAAPGTCQPVPFHSANQDHVSPQASATQTMPQKIYPASPCDYWNSAEVRSEVTTQQSQHNFLAIKGRSHSAERCLHKHSVWAKAQRNVVGRRAAVALMLESPVQRLVIQSERGRKAQLKKKLLSPFLTLYGGMMFSDSMY
ncbi:hypothetical protein JZ751_009754 [Albula glossodonta]|uniref:GATOR2 complex protein MIO zinc-ribbon like domain-containing protein n=1 Tax=Albula glossodonta TaxID=121402 RepID=A0A8T2NYP5_9TELE|nr:hypothetical protein JZ751_009754 [Albula glossodonta]